MKKTASVVGLGLAAVVMTCAVGCTGGERNPSPSSQSVQKGLLGNGGFTFRCDDSVACDRWNNANEFPEAVAAGSTFEMQFYLLDGTRGYSYLKDAESGTTIEPASEKYMKRGVSGLSTVTPGVATIMARDSKGWLVDYITVRVRKPDSLIIYDSEYKGDNPTRLNRVDIEEGQERSFRVVAQAGVEALAGSVTVEWSSDDKKIADVGGYSKGKVIVVATGKTGETTTLRAKGAGIEQTLTVTIGKATSTPTDGGTGDGGASDASTEGGQ